ncbi:MAG: polyhydroxyalkanoic acid system protein [Gammaproteobacteria bacterium HGW-Gammaproteobacteria-12]|nr:MAG: polyhydroxyalkanoic acid system protein [Gammaproteobacteria bacterium HGW-Gammaproteobacteria-12]
MSRIRVERSHSLGREAAREKAERLAERLASEYNVRYRWNGDTLEFKRSGAIQREIEQVLDKSLV